MYCKFCRSYLGIDDIVLCNHPDCTTLKEIIKKLGLSKTVKLLKMQMSITDSTVSSNPP